MEDSVFKNHENETKKPDDSLMPPPPVPSEKESETNEEFESEESRRLRTPLASMLPSKYANVNVTEFFPDFRPNKVLRFSRLFGTGKQGSLPHVWQKVKKRRKKLRNENKDHDSEGDQDIRRSKKFQVDI